MPAADASGPAAQAALDRLATRIAQVAPDGAMRWANAAFADALGLPRRTLLRGNLLDWLVDPRPMADALAAVGDQRVEMVRLQALMRTPMRSGPAAAPPGARASAPDAGMPVDAVLTQPEPGPGADVLVELVEVDQRERQDREEHAQDLLRANQDLVRNLAHEIKNPLGGIRGAAQLLAMDLQGQPELLDCTRVIIHEADRLQALVDRLLAPHRHPLSIGDVNLHEVCERVRAVVLAEHPKGLEIRRDYDVSLPDVRGNREQLIQVVLNLVQNAAQAMAGRIAWGDAQVVLRTRAARQVTIGKLRHKLALELQVQDNGPGVPEPIRARIFQPLVSGREGGSGLGLTLAQSYVERLGGTLVCESSAAGAVFRMLLPLP